MEPIGIISGTVALLGERISETFKKNNLNTEYGRACVFLSDIIAFIPRHGDGADHYILPHLINHQANMKALKDLGVKKIMGVHSTGSLKKKLKPGMIVIPDDFITLPGTPTAISGKPVHITPRLSDDMRRQCLEAARECKINVVDGGVYWQTTGPRLETIAEIRMMSRFADLVGMTMASEAVIAQELELSYASICSIDNYAHGLIEKAPTLEQISHNARRNADAIMKIVFQHTTKRRKK